MPLSSEEKVGETKFSEQKSLGWWDKIQLAKEPKNWARGLKPWRFSLKWLLGDQGERDPYNSKCLSPQGVALGGGGRKVDHNLVLIMWFHEKKNIIVKYVLYKLLS